MPLGVLTVRLDGWRTHANRRTARADRARDNAAELEGRARLTFGYEEVRDTRAPPRRSSRPGSASSDGEGSSRGARGAREH